MELITTLATVPAVIALVTLAKDLGLPKRLSPLLAVVLGIVLTLFDGFIQGNAFSVAGVMELIGTGIILGLSAAGLYDGATVIGNKRQEGRYAAQPGEEPTSLPKRNGDNQPTLPGL